jgi:predicted nucleic acid-binding protein
VDLVLGRPELTTLLVGQDLHVPAHFDVEAFGALRSVEIRDLASRRTVARARDDLAALNLVRYPAPPLIERAWSLRRNLTVQDAVYVALAEGLGCALFTTDEHLARAGRRLVEVIAPGVG